jgi:cytidyltransferase-like protein
MLCGRSWSRAKRWSWYPRARLRPERTTAGNGAKPPLRTFHDYRELPEDARGAVIALGNFDGVHHGHRSVFDETRRIAGRLSVPMGVVTFEPHPRSVLAPESLPFRLTSWKTKARALVTKRLRPFNLDGKTVHQVGMPAVDPVCNSHPTFKEGHLSLLL